MKKIYILLASFLLLACSPQKRLAYLLDHHPELHTDSILVIDTFVVHQTSSDSTRFTIEDLIKLQTTDPSAQRTDLQPAPTETRPPSQHSLSVTNGVSQASITPQADGSFLLTATQLPDTVYIKTEKEIPVYITKTQYVDKIIYMMTDRQRLIYNIGILALVLLTGGIILLVIKAF